jgi:hypothetical protein
MNRDQVAEGLNGGDHARNRFGVAGSGLENRPDHFPRRTAEFAQEPPVKPEINPQPFGNGKDKLAVRHWRADILAGPMRRLQRPFLMASGTETTAPAGKRHEELIGALRTSYAGETSLARLSHFSTRIDFFGRRTCEFPRKVEG